MVLFAGGTEVVGESVVSTEAEEEVVLDFVGSEPTV